MKFLFVGDVVGSPGRKGLREAMPGLLEQHAPDLAIVNGENSAGGLGITDRTGRDLFEMGFDVITLGNHTYRRKEAYDLPRRGRARDPPRQLHDRRRRARGT